METNSTTINKLFDEPFILIPQNVMNMLNRMAEGQTEGNEDPRDFDIEEYAEANFKGLCGEWAFSAYYGLEFDPDIGEADYGYDYIVEYLPTNNIGTVDVKTIEYKGGDLLMREWRKIKADIYFLTEKRENQVGLIGAATKKMMKEATVYEPGVYSPVAVRRVPRHKLNFVPKPDKLMGVVNKDSNGVSK